MLAGVRRTGLSFPARLGTRRRRQLSFAVGIVSEDLDIGVGGCRFSHWARNLSSTGSMEGSIGTANGSGKRKRKLAHVLMIPFEEEGHYTIFLDLVYHLSSLDITITFCSSRRRVQQLRELHSQGEFQSLDLRLVELSNDVSQPADKPGAMPMIWEIPGIMKRQFQSYREQLLAETNLDAKPTCLLADALLDWSEELAEELKIPRYLYFTCAGCMVYLQFKAAAGNLNPASDEMVDAVGLTVPAKEVPFKIFSLGRIHNLAGFLVNTFEEVEGTEAMEALRKFLPALTTKPGAKVSQYWPIGPTKLLPGTPHAAAKDRAAESKALKWLDEQTPSSVVYIAFGTMAHVFPDLISELARGLEISGVPFLWVLRTPVSTGHVSTLLPPGFLERTAKQGFVETSWAPQMQLLQHPSTGGFISHCGWNSCTEGLLAGVPFLTWPMHGDQPTNARFLVEKAKVGLHVRRPDHQGFVVKGEDVANAVKLLMLDPEGEEVRKTSARFKAEAQAAVKPGGSSLRNVKHFVEDILTR